MFVALQNVVLCRDDATCKLVADREDGQGFIDGAGNVVGVRSSYRVWRGLGDTCCWSRQRGERRCWVCKNGDKDKEGNKKGEHVWKFEVIDKSVGRRGDCKPQLSRM